MSQIVAPARRSPSPEVSQRRGGSPDKSSPIKHRRNKMQDPSLGPGPGSYALNVDKQTMGRHGKGGPRFSFGTADRFAYEKVGVQFISKRHSQTMPRLSPGPAQYDTAGESVSPKKNKRGTDAKCPEYQFGTSTRPFAPIARSPGPIYLPEDGLVKRASPTYSVGGGPSGRMRMRSTSPGPVYQTRESPGRGSPTKAGLPYSTFGGGRSRREHNETETTKLAQKPGPGAYEPSEYLTKRRPFEKSMYETFSWRKGATGRAKTVPPAANLSHTMDGGLQRFSGQAILSSPTGNAPSFSFPKEHRYWEY